MTTSNSSINLVDLDFDTLKTSLKTYLKSQTQFIDYDFDGSNMSVLLDLLSYNTFHNAFYLNMVASESYLDSAQLRNSVVSHAKELNYIPRSARSAKATVALNFSANSSVVTIPKGTSFTSLVGVNLYTFITDTESVYFSSNGTFSIPTLDVYEGQLITNQFIVNYENTVQRYVLSDPNIDTRSITVTVIEDNSGNIYTYEQALTTLDLDETSEVYFLQGAEDGKFEIVFGDDIIGRRPLDNAVVSVNYRVGNADAPNGASKFVLDHGFATFTSSPVVTTVDIARGGDVPETLGSIKFYAPRYFQTQERAINTSDYEIILKQRFPEINTVSAYGGEEIDPPQYGKVFISIDISDVDGLPASKLDEYFQYLKPRSPLSIDPMFIDPDYLYYAVTSDVKYDVNATVLNDDQIKSKIVNSIITYNDTQLNNFKSSFKYSKFVAGIDDVTDAGIISNDTDVEIYKKIFPLIGENRDLDILFDVPLTKRGSVLGTEYDSEDITAIHSSQFTFNGDTVQIDDDGNGIVRLIKQIGLKNVVVIPNIGTVDYETGAVKLINFRVDAINNGENSIRLYADTRSKDFSTKKNVILTLESDQIFITITAIRDGSSYSTQYR